MVQKSPTRGVRSLPIVQAATVRPPSIPLAVQYLTTPFRMAGPKFPSPLLANTIPTAFVTGLFFGLYLVTIGFANRWLFFTDEGWRLRKRLHWLMIIIANVIWALSVADCVVAVLVPMSQMAFIEAGNKPKEWANPAWNAIVKVRFSNTKLFQSSNPPPPVPCSAQ